MVRYRILLVEGATKILVRQLRDGESRTFKRKLCEMSSSAMQEAAIIMDSIIEVQVGVVIRV